MEKENFQPMLFANRLGIHLILGMGNPLLDYSAVVTSEFLSKYNLKANDAILYEKEDIFDDLASEYEVDIIAGGSTLNTVRAAQWLLGGPARSTAFFGCVGTDEAAATLKKLTADDGVDARFQESFEYPTGKCAVLITGKERSLVTNLEAAKHFTISHLEAAENWAVVEGCDVFYSAGFFLTVCPEAMVKVAKYASENDKYFAFNLSAPFLPQLFLEPMMKVLPYANLVFCNAAEVDSFAKVNKFETTDRKVMAKKIAEMPIEGHKSRMVVITQGSGDVILVDEAGLVHQFSVVKIAQDQIVDTNGAGDAFVGGFLAQLAKKKPLAKCVNCGTWAASEVIQQSGCTFPAKAYPDGTDT